MRRLLTRPSRFGLLGALVALLMLTMGCEPRTMVEPRPESGLDTGERSFRLLTLNDVYRIEGVEAGAAGGLARVRALREQLEGDDLLVLHAGDLLFPSLLSRQYKGQQMIDVLNHLDGEGSAFDERFFATFGNHEFDEDELEEAALLDQRVEESRFTWFDTNIRWQTDDHGEPLVAAPHMVPSKLLTVGGVEVGLFGISIDSQHPKYIESFLDPTETARRLTEELRRQGAEVVIALTHLEIENDVKLLEDLGDAGPDLVIGGHEHNRLCRRVVLDGATEPCVAEPGRVVVAEGGLERLVVKADAEARTVALLEVEVAEPGAAPRVKLEYRELGPRAPGDPAVSRVVEEWMVRFDEDYCREELEEPPGCLEEVVGHTRVKLLGEELEIRRYETNLGSWIAQQALEAHADRGVVAAFINSGSLRLNQDLLPGEVTLRHIEEIFQFPSYLRVLEIRGEVLQQVIEHSVSNWTGNGHWLQIAGFAFRHDTTRHTARGLTLLTPEGHRPVDPDEVLRVVTSDYMADPRTNQDGYRMLERDMWVEDGADALTLKDLVIEGLRRAEPEGIAPEVEGRICSTDREGPCLAVAR